MILSRIVGRVITRRCFVLGRMIGFGATASNIVTQFVAVQILEGVVRELVLTALASR